MAQRLALACLLVPLAGGGLAFANVAVGDKLEVRTLPRLGGGKAPYLGKAKANVFVFFTPGQPFSQEALSGLAEVQKELSGKKVEYVAIVSARYEAAVIDAEVKKAGFLGPVLLDTGDELYGELGGRLTPMIGVADQGHRLTAYLPFAKVNYMPVVKGWIARTLGEIDDAQLAAIIDPPRSENGSSEAAVARRWLKMGERQLANQLWPKAEESARKALTGAPESAGAHALLGAALAGQGRCAEAQPELERALAADPANVIAAEGRKQCAAPETAAVDPGAPDAGL